MVEVLLVCNYDNCAMFLALGIGATFVIFILSRKMANSKDLLQI